MQGYCLVSKVYDYPTRLDIGTNLELWVYKASQMGMYCSDNIL